MSRPLPTIPFDYLTLQDAAKTLGVSEGQLIHAAGSGALQLCVNIYARANGMTLSRLDADGCDLSDDQVAALSEIERREMELHEAARAEWLARCTTPMPHGIFEIDEEVARFFEMPETGSIPLYEAYKFDDRGWWIARFYDEQTDTGEPVLVERSDIVVMREEISRLLGPTRSTGPAEHRPTKLRSDREENLLRVIAGLWALSRLPSEHNTTADKLSALFDGWGWDKPAKSSIADTILKQAANLPGAGIRTSD